MSGLYHNQTQLTNPTLTPPASMAMKVINLELCIGTTSRCFQLPQADEEQFYLNTVLLRCAKKCFP
ncbi:hypothetical protein OUZ56_019422 [Daphnia magna]|uniref:Uncharacterized protein n=1 Tax=Daphnia magna TaxID=35525 RepID=A0ABQ9ZBI6_9CRUS|nr:hypothetical protein OUZ56_019422 [Daphnia magna]